MRTLSERDFKKFKWKPSTDKSFLDGYNFTPIFTFDNNGYTILVDILYTDSFPRRIYSTEIPKLLRARRNIRFCVLIKEDVSPKFIETYCKDNDYGLKTYNIHGEIETIVELDFERRVSVSREKVQDKGWFPKVILNELSSLTNITFGKILRNFITGINKCKNKRDSLDTVCKTIDKIFNSEKRFVGDKKQFVELAHFEQLVDINGVGSGEHVFHSFRVFLVGCIRIDRYYQIFVALYRKNFPGVRSFSIEYIWALTALFHDIGYRKQRNLKGMGIDTKKVDDEILGRYRSIMSQMTSSNWKENEYQDALENIICLISKFQYQKIIRIPFSGIAEYSRGLKHNEKIERYLINVYNNMESHSVISCFDLAAFIVKNIDALGIKRTKSRVFLFNHLYLAAVAICFHDWRLWKELTAQKIFPLKFNRYPFASLLIYIDTWDDYNRANDCSGSPIYIPTYEIGKDGAKVCIVWENKTAYEKEQIKYEGFVKALKNLPFKMDIDIKVGED